MPAKRPRRPKNAAVTKDAILSSACLAFTRAVYDGVGVREIAEAAGVTAMNVNRYFGSKEQLYTEVVAKVMAEPSIVTADVTTQRPDGGGFGRRMAEALVSQTVPGSAPVEAFQVLLRSASNPRAIEIWRQEIAKHFQDPLVDYFAGDTSRVRAALVFAVIAGFQLMRQVIEMPALIDADPSDLTGQLAVLFETLTTRAPS